MKKLFLVVFLITALSIAASAAPKAVFAPNAKPGDCAACHKTSPLPAGHVATKDLGYKDCVGCHELKGKLPLFHLHALRGVTCAKCHGAGKPEAVGTMKCISCHDNKALAVKTADLKPANPHQNRHYGIDADCNLCHHAHVKSHNHCGECHEKFNFIVP